MEPTKTAYDLKVLAEKLRGRGLDIAEEAAGIVYVELKAWLKESALLSENKIDDVVVAFLDQLDPIVLPQIDKIDGKVG